MIKELAHFKMTLLLIKDWDGFQQAMRKITLHSDQGKHSTYGECR